jgi:hypothetical protein
MHTYATCPAEGALTDLPPVWFQRRRVRVHTVGHPASVARSVCRGYPVRTRLKASTHALIQIGAAFSPPHGESGHQRRL